MSLKKRAAMFDDDNGWADEGPQIPVDWRNPYRVGNRRERQEVELRERMVKRLLGKPPKVVD